MKDWSVEIYDGDCLHNGKGDKAIKQQVYGTAWCPLCGASRGEGGLWRVIKEASK